MTKKNILPSSHDEYATIRLTAMQKKKVDEIVAKVFLKRPKYPNDMKLKIGNSENLSNAAKTRVVKNTLEIENP